MNQEAQYLAHRAKALLKELSAINYEIAQMVVTSRWKIVPDWFMVEIVRDLPRLAKLAGSTKSNCVRKKKDGKEENEKSNYGKT